MAQEKSSRRYTSRHEQHHKEDLKITFEDFWSDNNEDDPEEANKTCFMAVGSLKAQRNNRPQVDSWNANITNNVVALDSSTVNEPNTYHNKDIGEDESPLSFGEKNKSMLLKKRNKHQIIIHIFEDDIIFGSACEILCDEFVKCMHDKFKMNKLEDLKSILNLQITQGDNGIFISESKYLRSCLKKFDLENAKSIKTPIVSLCARFQDNHKESYMDAILHSDHAGDYADKKSTSEICTFVGGCLTQWCCKKQTALAISTTEFEYVTAGRACQQDLCMKQAIKDYNIQWKDVLRHCDNKGKIE
uniref:Reverse transcriptase Ty1/copia-type domain-containing protein n=1 Tax=Tanacetum cinerariifolium TaxID=118510 RepID=A0A6L2K3V6_TANCI|nr:hypothetical protein [Tanacetum cinerariifolium]